MMLVWITILLASVPVDSAYNRLNHIYTVNQLLNTCFRSRSNYHKEVPSEEKGLSQTCKPWRNRACCTAEMEVAIHDEKPIYNFEYSHCQKRISSKCLLQLRREHCISACSPNTGPWIVKVQGYKSYVERMYEMPLCQSECDRWWHACKEELTCVRVWSIEFVWSKKGNSCPNHKPCRPFTEVYKNSSDFCESIWDRKWRVVPDHPGRCFRMEFPPGPNPNDAVAKYWGTKLASASRPASSLPLVLAPLLLLLSF